MAAAGTPTIRISRRILERYLLEDEQPLVATRQHWAKVVEPCATALLGLLVVAAVSAALQREFGQVHWIVWAPWFFLMARALWRVAEWQHEWFVATDRRMLLVYGLVTHKVAMMPLRKVTDMNYGRTLLGRLLGYGHFVLESAGQDQAMREIRWVPAPDEKYRRICATIFGRAGDDEDDNGPGRAARAFEEPVENDPFEATFSDESESFVDRFDPDIVRIAPRRARREPRWEPVERHELPSDWDWVDDQARAARDATRRRVSVDPDPTPHE